MIMSKKNYYKISTIDVGKKVTQIIDGWVFETIIPEGAAIIKIKEESKNEQ